MLSHVQCRTKRGKGTVHQQPRASRHLLLLAGGSLGWRLHGSHSGHHSVDHPHFRPAQGLRPCWHNSTVVHSQPASLPCARIVQFRQHIAEVLKSGSMDKCCQEILHACCMHISFIESLNQCRAFCVARNSHSWSREGILSLEAAFTTALPQDTAFRSQNQASLCVVPGILHQPIIQGAPRGLLCDR